jgi:hypothetical protein
MPQLAQTTRGQNSRTGSISRDPLDAFFAVTQAAVQDIQGFALTPSDDAIYAGTGRPITSTRRSMASKFSISCAGIASRVLR